jgi:hypothetical protein
MDEPNQEGAAEMPDQKQEQNQTATYRRWQPLAPDLKKRLGFHISGCNISFLRSK